MKQKLGTQIVRRQAFPPSTGNPDNWKSAMAVAAAALRDSTPGFNGMVNRTVAASRTGSDRPRLSLPIASTVRAGILRIARMGT